MRPIVLLTLLLTSTLALAACDDRRYGDRSDWHRGDHHDERGYGYGEGGMGQGGGGRGW